MRQWRSIALQFTEMSISLQFWDSLQSIALQFNNVDLEWFSILHEYDRILKVKSFDHSRPKEEFTTKRRTWGGVAATKA